MADIDLERKQGGGMGWLWGLLAVLALVLIVWWVWPAADETEFADTDPIEAVESVTPATTPEPTAEAPGTSIGDILASPTDWVGDPFPGSEVRVTEVPTDRGFWIEDQGERMFAVIVDQPQEEPKDINAGQMLRIDRGMLRDASYLSNLPGAPLDTETEATAREQDIFLVVEEGAIDLMQDA